MFGIEVKLFFAVLAILLKSTAYITYIVSILRNKTKPHAISWLVWSLLTGVFFTIQIQNGAGFGAWLTGFSVIALSAIFMLSLYKGEKSIHAVDWACLVLALIALGLFFSLNNPIWSLCFALVADFLGFIPTFRKSYFKPFGEDITTWLLAWSSYVCSVLALQVYSIYTYASPAYPIVVEGVLVIYLIRRRAKVKR